MIIKSYILQGKTTGLKNKIPVARRIRVLNVVGIIAVAETIPLQTIEIL